MKTKISIIGMGNVGSTLAYTLAHKKIADEIVMLDVLKDPLEGHSMDLAHSMAWDGHGHVYQGEYPDIAESRIIVVTAGTGRKPGMNRFQLAERNAKVIMDIAASIRKYAPGAIIITLTNPVDVMNYIMWRTTGFPRESVLGQGAALDSFRFRWAISQILGIHPTEVEAYVIAEHGGSKVLVFSKILVRGKSKKLSVEEKMKVTELIEQSNETVLKKKGATVFGPTQAIVKMIDTIIADKKELIPTSIVLKGEYGLNDVSIGVPVILGRNGAEKIEQWDLEHSEGASFKRSAEKLQDMIAKV